MLIEIIQCNTYINHSSDLLYSCCDNTTVKGERQSCTGIVFIYLTQILDGIVIPKEINSLNGSRVEL
jgi:hypothetical protein